MARRNNNNKKDGKRYNNGSGRRQNMNNKSYSPKEVEVDIDRDDINSADLREKSKKYRSQKNDASWYARNELLLKAAASFPYGYPMGTSLPPSQKKTGLTIQYDQNVPGIFVLPYIPTIGRSESGSSPINLAAKLQYSNIRYANSGTTYGDPSDLMMYYLAIDSMYMFHQMCVRAYGTIRTYNYMNRFYPQAVIRAMGLDFDDLNANITQFWGFINTFAVKLQSFAVPGDISYFVRHSWLTSGIYLDSNTSKAQTYIMQPIAYYKWTEVTSGPNKLTTVSPYNWQTGKKSLVDQLTGSKAQSELTLLKLSDLMTFADSLMNPVLESESFGLTTGAILKSYGSDNLMKVGQIDLNYQVVPAYNAEVLSQIENATLNMGVDVGNSLSKFNITQSADVDDMFITAKPALVSFTDSNSASPTYRHTAFCLATYPPVDKLINMHIDAPTPADIMVATRLMTFVDEAPTVSPNATGSNYTLTANLSQFGSEIVVNPFLVTYNNDYQVGLSLVESAIEIPVLHFTLVSGNPNPVAASAATDENVFSPLEAMGLVQQFDWHPAVYIARGTNTDKGQPGTTENYFSFAYKYCNDTRDIDTFMIVNEKDVALMNQCAMLSLFDSPRVAEFVKQPYKRP